MIIILKRKFKEHSHQTKEDIKKMQTKYAKDILQPRREGEINPEFVHEYGAKNLNPTYKDVRQMARKNLKLAKVLDDQRAEANKNTDTED